MAGNSSVLHEHDGTETVENAQLSKLTVIAINSMENRSRKNGRAE